VATIDNPDPGAAGEHYGLAVATAWGFHPAVGARINRHILQRLRWMLEHGPVQTVAQVCEHILEIAGPLVMDHHPDDALNDYKLLLSKVQGSSQTGE
jgi:hypothetical protein